MARKEHFGVLVYDRERGDYIPFDADAAAIFEGSLTRSVDDLWVQFEPRLTRQSFDTFTALCRSIDLVDGGGRFNGVFVENRAVDGLLSAPLRVHLAITNECQMRCRHCSQDTRDPLPNELSTAECDALFAEMASIGCCQLAIGGGEPMLRSDFVAIVTNARRRGLSVSLSTTATSVNRTAIKKLADVGLKSIRVSLDGGAEKSYDYYRGVKGAYRKAMRGLNALRDVFPDTPITLHTTLMRANIQELSNLARAVRKLGLSSWSLDFVKPVGYGAEQSGAWLRRDEADALYKRLVGLAETVNVPFRMAHFPYKGSSHRSEIFGYRSLGGNVFCYVSPNGSLAPCSFTCRKFPAGNIRRRSLRDIWVDSEMLRRFRIGVAGPQGCGFCMDSASAGVAGISPDHVFTMPAGTVPAQPCP